MPGISFLSLLLHTLSIALLADAKVPEPHIPRCASDSFVKPQIGRDITILSVDAQPQLNFTTPPSKLLPTLEGLNFCQVQVYLSHRTPARAEPDPKHPNDKVLVEIWLPLTAEDWNGRLQIIGGGGFATGMFGAYLGIAVKDGWAAVVTDGGHEPSPIDASWAASGPLKWTLLHNFASRSAVDEVLVGKDITRQYFGANPHHSYWNGCSTGGRQGYSIAQKYPELLDGILAVAPAISFVNLLMGMMWPHLVMKRRNIMLSNCELANFQSHAIEACQAQQGVNNGVLEDPDECNWDPEEMVGTTIECGGKAVTVTKAMAEIVRMIMEGPRGTLSSTQFPGLPRGTSMTALANTAISDDDLRTLSPMPIPASFLQHLVSPSINIDDEDLDIDSFNAVWIAANYELGGLLNTDDPDLTRLRDSGTKMLTWHGIDDELIPYHNTINYRRKVEAVMGGAHAVDEYYRVFLAPGVAHCFGGNGPAPQNPLDAVVRWVENGEPPETLDAAIYDQEGDLVTKQLCLWPAKAKYLGIGDHKRASSWTCRGGTKRPARMDDEAEPWSQPHYDGMQQPEHVLHAE